MAAKVPEAELERAAAVISQHPGVSHNYRREHEYNLWYTLALPPDSRLGLDGTAQLLHRLSGATATRLLPTLRLFKIGVKFDFGSESDAAPHRPCAAAGADDGSGFTQELQDRATALPLTEADKRMIRVLQQDLPIESRPFDSWAEQAGVAVGDLLSAAETFRSQGRMRRFSAVLRHREVGFSANAMGVVGGPPGAAGIIRQDRRQLRRREPLLPPADLPGLALFGLHDGARHQPGGVRAGARRHLRRRRASRTTRRCTRPRNIKSPGSAISPARPRPGKKRTGTTPPKGGAWTVVWSDCHD